MTEAKFELAAVKNYFLGMEGRDRIDGNDKLACVFYVGDELSRRRYLSSISTVNRRRRVRGAKMHGRS
jgi:hypothetical protein